MALNFNDLVAEDTDEIVAPPEVNPTVAWLKDSQARNVAKRVPVPALDARALVNLIVRGAAEANLGVTIRVKVGSESYSNKSEFWTQLENAAGKFAETHPDEDPLSVVVVFTAKVRTPRPRAGSLKSTSV